MTTEETGNHDIAAFFHQLGREASDPSERARRLGATQTQEALRNISGQLKYRGGPEGGEADYLANAMEAASTEEEGLKPVAKSLRAGRPLTTDQRLLAIAFCASLREQLSNDLGRARMQVAQAAPKAKHLLSGVPSGLRDRDLPTDLLTALGLAPEKRERGRPSSQRPPLALLAEYELLLDLGASKTQTYEILASRFGYESRTIIAKLNDCRQMPRKRSRSVPFRKIRLLAFALREASSASPTELDFERTAEAFGLDLPQVDQRHRGARIVERAFAESVDGPADWARIPLMVAKAESQLEIEPWPQQEDITSTIEKAVESDRRIREVIDSEPYRGRGGASPIAITTVARELDLPDEFVELACESREISSHLFSLSPTEKKELLKLTDSLVKKVEDRWDEFGPRFIRKAIQANCTSWEGI